MRLSPLLVAVVFLSDMCVLYLFRISCRVSCCEKCGEDFLVGRKESVNDPKMLKNYIWVCSSSIWDAIHCSASVNY